MLNYKIRYVGPVSYTHLDVYKRQIYVSARSLGEINVQVVLEKIGGGGHQTISGAQFREKTVDEVKELVKNAIKQYLEEAE